MLLPHPACRPGPAGLANYFILAADNETCSKLPAQFNYLSCVWDTRPLAGGPSDAFFGILARRW